MRPGAAREWLARMALAAMGLLFGLGVTEAFVRWRWPALLPRYGTFELSSAGPMRAFRLAPDAGTGWRMPANRRYLIRSPEFESVIESNDEGFRSSRPQATRTGGPRLVAVIGDSVTEAVQVREDETFARRAEQALHQPGVRVDNYGISSLGYPHYLAVYRHAVRQHHPSLVVVCSFLVNDLFDGTDEGQRIPGLRPRFSREPDGRIQDLLPFEAKSAPEAQGLRALLRDHWATARLLRSLGQGEIQKVRPDSGLQVMPHLLDPWPASVESAWSVAEWSLRALFREARADGASVILVAIPGEDTGNDAAWEALRGATDRQLDRAQLSRHLAALCSEERVPFRDVSPEVEAAYRAGQRVHFAVDGHLSAAGHAVVAGALSGLIEEELATSR